MKQICLTILLFEKLCGITNLQEDIFVMCQENHKTQTPLDPSLLFFLNICHLHDLIHYSAIDLLLQ